MPPAFDEVYLPSANGRRVRSRLRHRGPPDGVDRTPWRFRAADLDLADHVNNAVYWEALEEDLDQAEPFDGEIEHRAPADAEDAWLLRSPGMLWLTDADGEVLASIALSTRF
jgi:hypothetical protein